MEASDDGDLVVFLDDDPALRAARLMTSSTRDAGDGAWLEGYLAPEVLPAGGGGLLASVHATAGFPRPVRTAVVPADELLAHPDTAAARAIVFRRGHVPTGVLAEAERLVTVQRYGHAPPDMDVAAFTGAGVAVCAVPRPSLHATAEHTVALVLALSKRLVEADAATRAGRERIRGLRGPGHVVANWAGLGDLRCLHDATVGIIGLGEVGRDVAERLRGFGCRLLYCNRRRLPAGTEERLGVGYAPLEDLLASADVVTIHATPGERGGPILTARHLAMMRPGALLVNTSRGWTVDEAALVDALEDGRLAGAGLDVFDREPLSATHPLVRLPQVVLTPHSAATSRFTVLDEARALTENVATALRGERPRFVLG